MMPTIAYFVSDHGLGHATRSVAIIRSLLECDLELSINIHTEKPLAFMQQSLTSIEDQRVDFHRQMNDFGYISDINTGKIDHRTTTKEIQSWVQDWHSSYLFNEYHYLKARGVDLIISDIAPQPFLLAKKLSIPSIAISNFTWFDIYHENPMCSQEDLNAIWKAYREASLGLMLPFNLQNTVFRTLLETHLVSRNPTRTKEQMRKSLELDPSSCVIYAGTGIAQKNPFLEEWSKDKELAFILGGQPPISMHNIRSIPVTDLEGQDYIACSDLALIKFGYSTVAEAIRSHIPIIGVDFAQTAETRFMKEIVEILGIGVSLSVDEYFKGKWKKLIPSALELQQNYSHLPERFMKCGESQIAGVILDLLEEIS